MQKMPQLSLTDTSTAKETATRLRRFSNMPRSTGITIAAVAAFYSHTNNRQLSGDTFEQLLNPRFGNDTSW